MIKFKLLIVTLFLIFSLTGCIPKQEDVKTALQSNAAALIRKDSKSILKSLLVFKEKLDKRNPKAFDKNLVKKINTAIKNPDKLLYLKYRNSTLENYKDYLQIAFSKDNIPSRNDYLILGVYYLLYDAYDLDNTHKLIALEYDKEKLEKLYKNLQILKWKLKTQKDLNGKYLFLTWQNNWQIELEKRINNKENITYETIKNLKYIKNGKETLLSPSNFSFEVILTGMMNSVENSLRALGGEPTALAVEGLGMFLFL